MWQNFSRKFVERKAWLGIVLPIWVLASFALAQVIVSIIMGLLDTFGVPWTAANENIISAVYSAVVYGLTLALVIGLPWAIKKYKTTKEDIGVTDYPRWLDLLLAPAGFIVYVILAGIMLMIATQLFPALNVQEAQDTGFSELVRGFEYLVAFLTLVVVAPVAEEILFRGYLLGKLRKHVPLWIAILLTSLLFAGLHWPVSVMIDVFVLSIVLCLLRVFSKSLWPSIFLHMIKNAIAFYVLFINPTLFTTLGG